MMLVDLFNAIVKLAQEASETNRKPAIIEHGGLHYWDVAVMDGPIQRETPPTLTLSTLTGLFDYVSSNIEVQDEELKKRFIRIQSPTSVVLHAEVNGPDMRRLTLAAVSAMVPEHQFGQYVPQDQFIVGLQARFVQDENLLAVIKAVSSVMAEVRAESTDDGVSQTVNARAGVVLKDRIALPNPVVLRPYRTFHEIEQPASQFVLRVNNDGRFALFEADGGAWRTEAMRSIGEWLSRQFSEKAQIFAVPILS